MRYYLEIDSVYGLHEAAGQKALFEEWIAAAPDLFPTHFAVDGPARRRIDTADLGGLAEEIGGLGWSMRRKVPAIRAALVPGVRHHGELWMEVNDADENRSIARGLSRLVSGLAAVLKTDYAAVHSLTAREEQEALTDGRPDLAILHLATMETSLTMGQTVPLRQGLKSLYWINVFGPAYVELFGRDVLAAAPVDEVAEGPGSITLTVTSEPPLDETYETYRAKRERVQDYLGRDAFWPGATRVPPTFMDFEPESFGGGP
jgi:hypothetical protein